MYPPFLKAASRSEAETLNDFLRLIPFALILTLAGSYFRGNYVVGDLTRNMELFSTCFLPVLSLFCHLAVLWIAPFPVYCSLALIDLILKVGIATYATIFLDNVDMNVIISNFGDGLKFADYAFDLIPRDYFTGGAVLTILLLIFAWRLRKDRRLVKRISLVLLLPIVPAFLATAFFAPLRSASGYDNYARCLKLRGYYITIVSDLLYSGLTPSDAFLISELEKEQKEGIRKLDISISNPHPYDRLVAIQAESLDYRIVDFLYQGKEVTPFLNSLKEKSIFIKLDPHHYGGCGSSGADYQLLTGRLPLKNYPVFRIEGLEFEECLPATFRTRNIDSYAYHGHFGAFFNRDSVFARMGFERFHDVSEFSEIDSRHGVSDKLFFRESARKIEESPGPGSFHFLITLSSHGPFNLVGNHRIQGRSKTARYLSAINYLDAALREFITSSRGRNLFVIYGDHASAVRDETYDSLENDQEFTAGFIFITDNGEIEQTDVDRLPGDLSEGGYSIASLFYFLKNNFP